MRQIDAAELMSTGGNYTSSYAKALLAATRQNDLVKSDQPKQVAGMTAEQMARVDNARQGFFERGEFDAVVALPSPALADLTRFAYLSGWRRGEIVSLRWDAVDRAGREIRLRTSKNGHGRVLPLEGALWDLIEQRCAT